jgi:uncharacterized membrane protein YdfJ with MMPL/SSD domain
MLALAQAGALQNSQSPVRYRFKAGDLGEKLTNMPLSIKECLLFAAPLALVILLIAYGSV